MCFCQASVTAPESFNKPACVWSAHVNFGFECRHCAEKHDMKYACGFCLKTREMTTCTLASSVCYVHGGQWNVCTGGDKRC